MNEGQPQPQEEDFTPEAAPVSQPSGIDQRQLVNVRVPLSEAARIGQNGTHRAAQSLPIHRTPKEVTAKEFLEDLIMNPESISYNLAVHRFAPAVDDKGNEVIRGQLMMVPLMPLDTLTSEIQNSWGGGMYRAVVVDASGSPVVNMTYKSAIQISIPVTQFPPKNERFSKVQSHALAVSNPVAPGSTDDQILEIRKQEQLADLQFKAEMKQSERELEKLRIQKERSQLLGLNNQQPQNNEIAELKRQMEADRNSFFSTLKDLTSNFTSTIEKINSKIESVANSNQQNQQNSLIATVMDSQSKVLAAALTPRKDEGDNLKYMELMLKATARDNTLQNSIVNNLISTMNQPKEQMSMKDTIEILTKCMSIGESKFTNALKVWQEQNGGDDDSGIAAAMAGITPGQKLGEGWMGVVQSLLSNPAIAPLVGTIAAKIFGTANPQPQHFEHAARRLPPQIPPMLPVQQPPQLGTFQTAPALQQQGRPVAQMQQSMQQQFVVPPAPNPTQVFTLPPATQQSNSATLPGVPETPAAKPEAQSQEAADALAALSAAAGHTPTDENALDGEVEEIEEDPSTSKDPHVRLKHYVTETMRIALVDIKDKRMTREWPQDAYSYWGQEFLIALSKQPRDVGFNQMIAQFTDDDVWNELVSLLQADQKESDKFFAEYDQLIIAVKEFVEKNLTPSTLSAQQTATQPPAAPETPPALPVDQGAQTNAAVAVELATT